MVEEKEISAEFEGLVHGLSPERIITATIHPMMICPMCDRIFWNPQTCSTSDCGRTLCEPCLKLTVELRETCEDCLQPMKYDPNTFLAKSLKDLTFKCYNHPKCQETFTYKDLPYHICPHTQLKCPISECEWEGERQELEKHLPQCPKEIIRCQNEGCGNKHQRGNMGNHRSECMFQNISCPQFCGFEGKRGQLEEHLTILCPLVQVECGYKGRGCEYNPMRKDYQDHLFGCLYQPKLLKCGHQVNLKDEDEHSEVCHEFPLPCSQCGYILTRGQLLGHHCLSFLHGLIAQQEKKIQTQEHDIASQKNKNDMQDDQIIILGHKIAALESIIRSCKPQICLEEEEEERKFEDIKEEQKSLFPPIFSRIERENLILNEITEIKEGMTCIECERLDRKVVGRLDSCYGGCFIQMCHYCVTNSFNEDKSPSCPNCHSYIYPEELERVFNVSAVPASQLVTCMFHEDQVPLDLIRTIDCDCRVCERCLINYIKYVYEHEELEMKAFICKKCNSPEKIISFGILKAFDLEALEVICHRGYEKYNTLS